MALRSPHVTETIAGQERRHHTELMYLVEEEQRKETARCKALQRARDARIKERLERNFKMARALARRRILSVKRDNEACLELQHLENHAKVQDEARLFLRQKVLMARRLSQFDRKRIATDVAAQGAARTVKTRLAEAHQRKILAENERKLAKHRARQQEVVVELRLMAQRARVHVPVQALLATMWAAAMPRAARTLGIESRDVAARNLQRVVRRWQRWQRGAMVYRKWSLKDAGKEGGKGKKKRRTT